MIEKFNKNAKVEKLTKKVGRGVRLIVIGPFFPIIPDRSIRIDRHWSGVGRLSGVNVVLAKHFYWKELTFKTYDYLNSLPSAIKMHSKSQKTVD